MTKTELIRLLEQELPGFAQACCAPVDKMLLCFFDESAAAILMDAAGDRNKLRWLGTQQIATAQVRDCPSPEVILMPMPLGQIFRRVSIFPRPAEHMYIRVMAETGEVFTLPPELVEWKGPIR